MAKTKKQQKDENEDFVLRVKAKDEEEARRLIASTIARPSVNAASVVKEYNRNIGLLEMGALVQELSAQCSAVNDGDMKRAEAMLIAQAHALQSIFTNLAWRASRAEYMSTFQPYLSLALKAQSQCRATLQTLGELKYPKETAFIRQQNVAVNQQVNNASDTHACAPAREKSPAQEKFSNSTNELLENHHERLDIAAPATAGGADPTLETVGAVERAENGKR
jgi:hypothetical protein